MSEKQTPRPAGAILPGILALLVMLAWILWPQRRDVVLEIGGLPDWGFVSVSLGRTRPDTVEEGGIAARRFGFRRVSVREHTVHVAGGARPDEKSACDRCCWELELPLKVQKGSKPLKVELLAATPRCPTAETDTPFLRVEPGTTSIDGQAVQIRRPIQVSQGEVPQKLWLAVFGQGGCPGAAPGDPVGCVSWREALFFANLLSRMEGLQPVYYQDEAHQFPFKGGEQDVHWRRQADGYRLLTEAEWAYIAHAGQPPAHLVSAAPNAWGFHGTRGSVWEWTWDQHSDPYEKEQLYSGPIESESPHTVRGGAWNLSPAPQEPVLRRALSWDERSPEVGLRLARNLPLEEEREEIEVIRARQRD